MEKSSSIFRDLANYLSGRVVLLVLGFASFPLLTRMLSVPEYGVLSLTLRVVLVLTVFSKCGFQYSVNRFYHETIADGSPEAHRRYYSTLVFVPLGIALGVALLYLGPLLIAYSHIQDHLMRSCFLLAAPLVLVRVLQSLLLGFLRNEGKSRLHSIFEVATKSLTLAALICLFISPYHGAVSFLAASVLSESVIVLLQLRALLNRKMLHLRDVDWTLARVSFVFGVPLIAYEFASVVLDSGDRFLVQHFLGDVQLGYYSAAYNIGSYFQDIVMSPMNLAFLPIYMRLWTQDGPEPTRKFISNALTWFLVAIFFITCMTLLCSENVIVLLASRRYLQAHVLLPILIPSLMLYATHIFLNAGMIFTKRTGLMAKLVVISAAVNIGMNLFLIPRFGIVGAAYATTVGYALLIAMMAVLNQRILPLNLDFYLLGSSSLAAAVTYLAVERISPHNVFLSLASRLLAGSLLFTLLLALFSGRVRAVLGAGISRLIRMNRTESVRV